MASRLHTCKSFYINSLANIIEQDKLADQNSAQKSNAKSNEVLTKVFIPLEVFILFLVPFSTKDLFTKFMKVFIKTMQVQAWDQEQLQP